MRSNAQKHVITFILSFVLVLVIIIAMRIDRVSAASGSEGIPGTDAPEAGSVQRYGYPVGTVKITSSAIKKAVADIDIAFNSKTLTAKAFKVKGRVNGSKTTFLYVPAKTIASKLKASYKKSGKSVTVTIKKGTYTVTLVFNTGKDIYSMMLEEKGADSSTGRTCSFGKAYKKDGSVYVPVDVFAAMLDNDQVGGTFNVDYENGVLSIKTKKTTDTDDQSPITGGYGTLKTPEITSELNEIFKKATEDYKDDEITPVAYLAKQVVAGINHRVLCRYKKAGSSETYAIVTIYADLQGGASILDIRNTGVETNINDLDGGWSQAESPVIGDELLKPVESSFSGLVGVKYVPIAILADQVVAGRNYCILCEAKGAYLGAETDYAFVYVYQGFDGSVEITDIVRAE